MEHDICAAIAREIGENLDTSILNLGLLVLSSTLLTINTLISRRAQIRADQIHDEISTNGK